jgi:hypothetical protein
MSHRKNPHLLDDPSVVIITNCVFRYCVRATMQFRLPCSACERPRVCPDQGPKGSALGAPSKQRCDSGARDSRRSGRGTDGPGGRLARWSREAFAEGRAVSARAHQLWGAGRVCATGGATASGRLARSTRGQVGAGWTSQKGQNQFGIKQSGIK